MSALALPLALFALSAACMALAVWPRRRRYKVRMIPRGDAYRYTLAALTMADVRAWRAVNKGL